MNSHCHLVFDIIDLASIVGVSGNQSQAVCQRGVDASRLDAFIQVDLGVVLRRHPVKFATFFVESKPPFLTALVMILRVHSDHAIHSGKAIDHGSRNGPIA